MIAAVPALWLGQTGVNADDILLPPPWGQRTCADRALSRTILEVWACTVKAFADAFLQVSLPCPLHSPAALLPPAGVTNHIGDDLFTRPWGPRGLIVPELQETIIIGKSPWQGTAQSTD